MIIFTDGSTINNGKKNAYGGIGVYIPNQDDFTESRISYSLKSTDKIKVTNQISELIASIIGIEIGINMTNETIYIYTDSKYVIDCATTWNKSWIANNWKKSNGKCVDNIWLVYRLIQLTKKYPVIFKHVKAHTVEPKNKTGIEYLLWLGNNTVDNLAQNASKSIIELRDDVKSLNWNSLAVLLINGMKRDHKINVPYCNEINVFYQKTFNIDTQNNNKTSNLTTHISEHDDKWDVEYSDDDINEIDCDKKK
jgi:ribonuclease HI